MPYAAKTHAQQLAARRQPAEAKAYDQARGTAASRGYGHTWRRLVVMVLARDPLCTTPGCHRPSTQVDHITARRAGGPDTMANLQGLCMSCHSRKTRAEHAHKPEGNPTP